MSSKVKLTQNEKMALITKAVEAHAQNNLPQFEFVIFVSAIIDQEEVSLTDLGWGTRELEEIRKPASERKCFSCQEDSQLGPVMYYAPKFGYDLCEFHADMGLVVGWQIYPINQTEESVLKRLFDEYVSEKPDDDGSEVYGSYRSQARDQTDDFLAWLQRRQDKANKQQ